MDGLETVKRVGLKIDECKKIFAPVRCEISLQSAEKILNEKFCQPNGIFVAWQIQSVVFGKFENGKLKLKNALPEVENFLECRIFNDGEELHLKKIGGEFCGRYVREEEGSGDFFADSFSRFWGEFQGAENDFVKLVDEERKICLEIPTEIKAKYYGLLTRNYIGFDEETGLGGYVDYRFVKIGGADIV